MRCDDVRRAVYLFLDGSLDEHEQLDFTATSVSAPTANAHEVHRRIRVFILAACAPAGAPERLSSALLRRSARSEHEWARDRRDDAHPRLLQSEQRHRSRAHPRRASAARVDPAARDPGGAVEEISRYKLEVARTKGYHRLIVEDVSLGFDELGNFPGPYVKWLLEAAGGKGLAAIAYALNDRAAHAQCCVAYWDGGRATSSSASAAGEVLVEPRGEQKFGWDAWFRPRGKDVRRNVTRGERRRLASRRRLSSTRGSSYECRILRTEVSPREDATPNSPPLSSVQVTEIR